MRGNKIKIFLECLVFPENESLWDWVAKQDHVPFDTTGESLVQCYHEAQKEIFDAFEKNGFGYIWYTNGRIYGNSPNAQLLPRNSIRIDIVKYKQLLRQLLIENILDDLQ
jgi:hypothetical protein